MAHLVLAAVLLEVDLEVGGGLGLVQDRVLVDVGQGVPGVHHGRGLHLERVGKLEVNGVEVVCCGGLETNKRKEVKLKVTWS